MIDNQNTLSSIQTRKVVACPFVGAFALADESAGYKTMLRLMPWGVTFQRIQNPRAFCPLNPGCKGTKHDSKGRQET
jgi:hypothetical protein